MSTLKYLLFLFIISLIKSQENITYIMQMGKSPEPTIYSEEKRVNLNIDITNIKNKNANNLIFYLYPNNNYNYLKVYLSLSNKNPTFDDCDYKILSDSKPTFYLSKKEFESIDFFYISVECKDNCYFYYSGHGMYDSYLIERTKFTKFFNLKEKLITKFNFDNINTPILFTALSSDSDEICFKVTSNNKNEEIIPKKILPNSYGIILQSNTKNNLKNAEFQFYNCLENKVNYALISTVQIFKDDFYEKIDLFENVITAINSPLTNRKLFKFTSKKQGKYSIRIETISLNLIVEVVNHERKDNQYKKQKEIKQIGFIDLDLESNKEYDINFYVENPSKNIIGIRFQIIYYEEIIDFQFKNMEIIRNIPTRDFLPKGKINYYRVISKGDNFTTLEYHLHILNGYPILYYIKCIDFPNCKYNYDDIKKEIEKGNAITNQDINDNIFIFVNPEEGDFYLNKTQYLAVVYCDENKTKYDDCEYQIEIHNTKGKGGNLILLDNVITYDSIKKSDSDYDYYKFEVIDNTTNYVHIISYCFSGYINLNTKFLGKSFKEINRINYGNIEEYVYKRDNTIEIDGYFNLQIIGKDNSFYSLLYYTENEDYSFIKSGEENIKILKFGEKKSIRFKNRNINDKSSYIININAINCILKAKLNEREEIEIKNHQFILKSDDLDYPIKYYQVNISVLKFDDIDNKQYDYCIYQISGIENFNERELTLNEGYNHIANFNKDISSFTYIYPYYLNQIEGDEELFFSIIKNDNSKYKIISKINQGENIENDFILNEKKLVFLKDDLKKNCKNILICPIKIIIKLTSEIKEGENYQISFKFLSSHNIPKYLNSINEKDGVITDSDNKLLNSKYNYFYKDIKKLEKNQFEIYYIDFIRGHGNVLVKLIPKNIIEENSNWNRRIVLPSNDDKNGTFYIEYNEENHFFKLDDKITEKCSDFNCEVYIGIYSLDYYDDDLINFEDKENYKLNEFTIRNLKYTNIKENELLNFYLNENNNNVNLNFNIEKNSDVVYINFNSDSCYLNIETEVDSKKVSWEINSSNELFLIKSNDEQIKKDNLKGLNFNLIGNLEKNSIECKFSIKYYIPEKNYPEIFIADSNIETIGKFNDNNLVYFVVPILLVQKVKNVGIYLNDNNKLNSDDLVIHANILELNEYLNLDTPEKIINKFPTSEDHDYTSKDNFNKNYLFINRIGDKNLDYIILITVENISENKSNSLVNLLTTFDKVKNSLKVNNDKFELAKIYKEKKKVKLNLSGRNNTFYFEIGLSDGEIQFENLVRQIEKFNLTKGRIYGLFYNPLLGEELQIENYVHLGSSLFFLRFTKNDFKNNINKISYNNRNIIRFNTKYSKIKFPISFYTNIDKDIIFFDNDIQISIKLIKENKFNKSNDNFTLIGGLVNNDFINKVKYTNEKIEPEICSENIFNDGLREARFIFKNKIIKDNINQNGNFFVLINNDDQIYNNFIAEVNILKIGLTNEKLVIPDNNYYFSNITSNIQIYKLKKKTENDEKMIIEFSSSFSDNYYITINKENSLNYTKNYTDFIKKDFFKYGKSYIEIDLTQSTNIKYIIFSIIKNETKLEKKNIRKNKNDNSTINNFILKYQTDNFYNFTLPNETITFLNDTFSVKRIMREKTLVEDAVYYMNIYSKNEIKDKNQLDKLSSLIKPKYKFNPTNFTEKDVLFKLDESILKEGNFFVCILVTAYYNDDQEILQYDIFEFGSYNPPIPDENKSKWWIWIIIILIVIIIGFVIYIYLFKNKITTNDINTNTYDLNNVSGGLLDEKVN